MFSLDVKKMELLYELLQFECLPEAGEYAPRSGLFRPLRSPVLHLGKGIGVRVEDFVSR